RYNIDGYLCHNTEAKPQVCHSYVQFFRSGAIEAVETRMLSNRDGDKLFPAPAVERERGDAVRQYLTVYQGVEVEPPIVVMVSLLGVKGYYIPGGNFRDVKASFDRDVLLLPD